MTSAAAPPAPAVPRLRRNAVGLTGAVIMSAAIMGPAVSTFFNPQFSTPFSGAATPVRLPRLPDRDPDRRVRHRRDGPRASERRRVLHLCHPRAGSARRVRHRRPDVRRLRLAATGRGRADRVVPADHVPRRVRFERPLVDHRARPGGADDAAGLRGHPLVPAGGPDPVHARGARGGRPGADHRRPGRSRRADAGAAQPGGLAQRLRRAHHRVRVRRPELRRLRGRGHARRRGPRAAPRSSRAPCSPASCSSG